MCGSMVDIQSPTAENRREKEKKKKERTQKPQDENRMAINMHTIQYNRPTIKGNRRHDRAQYIDWVVMT